MKYRLSLAVLAGLALLTAAIAGCASKTVEVKDAHASYTQGGQTIGAGAGDVILSGSAN